MAPGRVRWALLLLWAVLLPRASNAGQLYTSVDPLYILDGSSVQRAVFNSSSAWVLEFYSSWCGHCVNYAPTWRALANDVTEWEPAIKIGVLDCAEEKNYETCKEYGIKSYPTFRFFKAFTKEFTTGESYKGVSIWRQLGVVEMTPWKILLLKLCVKMS